MTLAVARSSCGAHVTFHRSFAVSLNTTEKERRGLSVRVYACLYVSFVSGKINKKGVHQQRESELERGTHACTRARVNAANNRQWARDERASVGIHSRVLFLMEL